MTDDALQRLLNQERPTVPARDESIVSNGVNPSLRHDLDTPLLTDEIQLVRWTVRLEESAADRILGHCKGLNRDALIEAMFEVSESDPALWERILETARRKYAHRQNIGNKKRARSMMNRFG